MRTSSRVGQECPTYRNAIERRLVSSFRREHVLAEKKGIRVNALAKELGVESKAILQKLKEEGLGDIAPNHMSVIQLGLAESVREWFAHAAGEMGGGGTAVETAAPVDVAVAKPKTARSRKKKEAEASGGTEEGGGVST